MNNDTLIKQTETQLTGRSDQSFYTRIHNVKIININKNKNKNPP